MSSLSSLALRPAHTARHWTSQTYRQPVDPESVLALLGPGPWVLQVADRSGRLYEPCGAPTGAEGR